MEMFNYTSFPHFREDRAITKDSDYLQNIDKQAKVRDLKKHIDHVACVVSPVTRHNLRTDITQCIGNKRDTACFSW